MKTKGIPWKGQIADEAHARIKLLVSGKFAEIDWDNKRYDVRQTGSMIEEGYG